jgi:hypothetical protein
MVVSGMEAGNASAACPSTPIRIRLGQSMDITSPARWAASVAAANDTGGRRRGGSDLPSPAAMDPLRHHHAEASGVEDLENARDARHVDAFQTDGAREDLVDELFRQLAVRVDQRQGHVVPGRHVEALPELQMCTPAVRRQ